MPDFSPTAIAAATLVAFMIGGAYYGALGDRLAEAASVSPSESPAPWTMVVELARCLLIALVVAGIAAEADIDDLAGGLLLGAALWIGFPLVLWVGAIVHEKTPLGVAAIHAGDWLLKLLAVAALIAVIQ